MRSRSRDVAASADVAALASALTRILSDVTHIAGGDIIGRRQAS